MSPRGRAGWFPARDRREPDAHLVFSKHGNGACGVAVIPADPSRTPTDYPRCAVCAGLAEATDMPSPRRDVPPHGRDQQQRSTTWK
ncbi:hypothetical protein JOF55_000259 [Haloactinomyces albus]|uniref:Uncharacterized protein n=1 Tax=Haloactinomyces albus TaxID=1352928 RepID=A0AAE3Z845_9ACTN|nr:hypothetical protein [Haloactinomyces albus]